MIRKMNLKEVDLVGDIWLQGNLEAHDFVDPHFWINNQEAVKQQFLKAEIYVYANPDPVGFVGLQGDYIAGIFVLKHYQGRHIGQQLLDYLKKQHQRLELDVYEKNQSALRFYSRNGFTKSKTDFDENEEKEFHMIWREINNESMVDN
ncbi:GNAT family N-acetyltransferase [Companilactobacillus suantsaicola]|uniref:GNAT family N-acetyltransferase n=1 Tax=Companilactobacillus suantsaicola TaxID=2487723 RepID=A0A4Z0JGX6_9LACO|nr:GNAT family N-acetyltransferase [Companilactobacillus suantsaicola]TGD21211.1 GNAT family N-acetyltransferase [Companilactobacillus suantsaicola]